MKFNELVCPSCGLKCLVDAAYTTCDGCQTYFSAAQSRSRDNPAPLGQSVTITWPGITVDPNIQIQPLTTPWITPNDPGVTGPGIIGSGGTVCTTSGPQVEGLLIN